MNGLQITYYLKGEDGVKNEFFAGERPENFERAQKKCANDYQYAYTDHLGNVRMIYTSNPDVTTFMANMEAAPNQADDDLFEGTNSTADVLATSGSSVTRLTAGQISGPALTLPVYPGDTIAMQVQGFYRGGSGTSTADVSTLIAAVAGTFGGMNGGSTSEQAVFDAFDQAINPALGGFGLQQAASGEVAAYLNYIMFDKNMQVVQHGHWVMDDNALANPTLMKMTPAPVAQKEGFIYVYLTNESDSEVYFDDFEVTVKESLVVQNTNYYPFGLTTSDSWTRPTDLKNNFLFNAGSELNEETGNYETFYRQYDAAIGRFTAVDIMAGAYSSQTPYQYANNDPVYFNDPLGDYGRGGSIYDEMKDRMGHKSTGPANDGFSGYFYGESFAQQFNTRMAYRNEVLSWAQAGYAHAHQEYAQMYGEGFSGSLDVFSATSMRTYHFGDGRMTGYTTYAYSNLGGQVNHYRLDGSDGGYGSGLLDGVVGGLSSSWEFVKGLATVDGWIGLGEGLLNLAHMASSSPDAMVDKAILGAEIAVAVKNIPNMSAYDLGYATGYGVEKVAEAVLLSKGAGVAKGAMQSTRAVKAAESMGSLKNVSGSLDEAAALARNQPYGPNTNVFRRLPRNAQDVQALTEAQMGMGRNLNLTLKDPRYIGWEKWHHSVGPKGGKSVVHYLRNPETGFLTDFKFK
ncbi:hypothetical protein LVD17_27200 [Fulvivirga ulvae]|uniref:RHS repeat-associated core domain-containing protein n=1 Tax=Fulvivirga ulvae TaxID=2904245 RepID=UPI001F2AE7E3|nr:RHS repeat-associated core domain-containing protein [Fulvivirga ulvae]UII31979.1 hypothetical protein LVD17_27200 [Fulvivirga ulvae]